MDFVPRGVGCQLFHGDCLLEMKDIEDNSIDLIFCDLPYGQTSCKWDCKIDLEKFWTQVMRIKKLHTPIFMTTTTKFGVELIQSAPKKCYFRYDIVWVKSAPAGFLSAKKMPMRKHEMVYVFYEKLPLYDLSSHKHKFIKEKKGTIDGNEVYKGKKVLYRNQSGTYDPALPTSVVKEISNDNMYRGGKGKPLLQHDYDKKGRKGGESAYNPPLPTSVVKGLDEYEGDELCKYDVNKNTYGGGKANRIKVPKDKKYHETKYDPPLPTSVVKEHETIYGNIEIEEPAARKNGESRWNPPLPTSVVKEEPYDTNKGSTMINGTLGGAYDSRWQKGHQGNSYDPPLPTSIVTEDNVKEPEPEQEYVAPKMRKNTNVKTAYGTNTHYSYPEQKNSESIYDPPLPNSLLEIKSTRGKHSTEKPVALMEWILKYYSKEGDVVLDPTMGSGSTGVACMNMERNFIGIEMDQEIFETACERLSY